VVRKKVALCYRVLCLCIKKFCNCCFNTKCTKENLNVQITTLVYKPQSVSSSTYNVKLYVSRDEQKTGLTLYEMRSQLGQFFI